MTRSSDQELLRSIYRRLDRKAVLQDHPGLTEKKLVEFFRRADALLSQPRAPDKSAVVAGREAAPEARRPSGAGDSAGHRKLILHTDGGSRGNPGPGGYGIVLMDESGRVIAERGKFIGRTTCNEAEYAGLIAGLEEARTHGASEILIRSDSQLLVRQIQGEYKVKSRRLMPLFLRAREMLQEFAAWRAEHVPREQNSRADALANEAMDDGPR